MDDLLQKLKALAEPSRLRLLSVCSQGEFTVSELVHIVAESQPSVSRHLKILCDAGLLERLREGSWVIYHVLPESGVVDLVENILAHVDQNKSIMIQDKARMDIVKTDRIKSAVEYFRLNAKQWDQIRGLHADDQKIEEVILKIFTEAPLDNLLDIGTGTGRILELASPHVKQLFGIDLSREMLSIARENLDRSNITNCKLRQGDMHELPFVDKKFDLACIHQALHFANEPNRVIYDASRVLKVGGKLIVVDFASHELEQLREEFYHRRLGFSDGELVHWFQRNNLIYRPPIKFYGDPLVVTLWIGIKTNGNS